MCDPLPIHGEAALEQLDHELPDELVRLVVGAEQQQRLLELLDVELEEVEGLPGDRLVRAGSDTPLREGLENLPPV